MEFLKDGSVVIDDSFANSPFDKALEDYTDEEIEKAREFYRKFGMPFFLNTKEYLKRKLMKRCIELLKEVALAPSDDTYGMPPKTYFMDYGIADESGTGTIKTVLETYRYTNGTVEQVVTGTKNRKEPVNGTYYPEGYAAIGIDKDNNYAYLSFIVGPRCGRGFRYEIVDGKVAKTLGEEAQIWVS